MVSKRHLKRLVKKEQDKIMEELRDANMDEEQVPEDVEENICIVGDEKKQVLELMEIEEVIWNEKNSAQTCENRLNEFEKSMIRQFEVLGRALGEQKAMVAQLIKQRVVNKQRAQEFPIKTDEELIKINEDIQNGDRDGYEQTIKMLLRPHGVIKNLKYIITDQMMDNYNIDGFLGKKSLKKFNFFYDTLIGSISFGETRTSEEQLRKAIQLQKKRFAKKIRNTFKIL